MLNTRQIYLTGLQKVTPCGAGCEFLPRLHPENALSRWPHFRTVTDCAYRPALMILRVNLPRSL